MSWESKEIRSLKRRAVCFISLGCLQADLFEFVRERAKEENFEKYRKQIVSRILRVVFL